MRQVGRKGTIEEKLSDTQVRALAWTHCDVFGTSQVYHNLELIEIHRIQRVRVVPVNYDLP